LGPNRNLPDRIGEIVGRFRAAAIRLSIIFAITVPALALVEKGVFPAGKSDCLSQYRKWQAKKSHWAAFAVNEWTSSGQACGWALGLGLKRSAVAKAMADCRKLSKHPRHGLKGTCFIYDIK
jgi:hypothetical protein